ncbi:hypothetical protein M1N11_05325 [Peptococcaceae bacterium]|nr:hypothetical protein [Peptococcaceae bacterium]
MCEKFKIAYTEKEAVINKVNRYRIDKGWITIMLIHPSIEITYDALFIANELEFDKYNREKIKNYAVSYVENPPKDFKKFYYALKVLQ